MARIALVDTGFTIIPEGTYVFKVANVTYKPDFGKLILELVTKDGQKITERYSLLNANRTPNEGAMKAFSYMARCCMNFNVGEDIDPDELIGKYVIAEVKHTEVDSTQNPGQKRVFANLGDKAPAPNGFDTVLSGDTETTPAEEVDLDGLLDD